VATVWSPTASLDSLVGASVRGRLVPVYRELDEIAAERSSDIATNGCALARAAGLQAEAEVVEDRRVAAGVQRLVERHEAGLVVVGGRAAAGCHPMVHGSVAVALLHGASVPVLIVGMGSEDRRDRGAHLLACDGCASSRNAIAAAARLLRGNQAIVVHVWLPPSHVLLWNPLLGGLGPLAEPAALLDEASAEAAQQLAAEGAELARDAGFQARGVALPSEHGTWRTLLRAASDLDVETLVTGTHGRAPADVVLGSVAERVVRHAQRPVLVVPAGGG
jgi:nucleotide-binding universal stress UspA family protein